MVASSRRYLLRTGLSWADSLRPQALAWFDRQMQALEEFDVTLTFCFTPESRGVMPHYTSPPQRLEEFADFCVEMVRRYAPGTALSPQRRRVDMLQAHARRQHQSRAAGPCLRIGLMSVSHRSL